MLHLDEDRFVFAQFAAAPLGRDEDGRIVGHIALDAAGLLLRPLQDRNQRMGVALSVAS